MGTVAYSELVEDVPYLSLDREADKEAGDDVLDDDASAMSLRISNDAG